jgi:flagellar protein FlgJ
MGGQTIAGMTGDLGMKRQTNEGHALFDRMLAQQKIAPESGVAAKTTAVIDKNDKLYEQCLALETFLVKTLVSGMRKTVMKSELIDTGFAGEMYEDMLYDEYTKNFTKNANFGLAETAYLELTGQRGKQLPRESI